ncbi:hypothetical protein [Ruegeria sp. EL01]|jgi:hypothetical protein|uniref:hypothetical protein n=1 Tax=Ruegeria sp. EL01 TaxID=2107578 RepID=UPI000EA821A8|nr:hypothetical protein [Ruegeria sp. EL01]
MGWRVCLCDDGVEPGDDIIDVYNFGEVSTPELIGDVGLDLTTTRDLLGNLQSAIVALQEDCLRAGALAQARSLPGVELKDYRQRKIQTLFGEVAFSIPRLRTRDGSILFVDWPKHARAHPELDYIRAQFCAWMSFGKAQKMLDRMFPVNVGISGVTLLSLYP